jgi:hypothetical protein
MNRNLSALLAAVLLSCYACDSKSDTVTKGREAVKEVITQPFNTLEGAKESLTRAPIKPKLRSTNSKEANNLEMILAIPTVEACASFDFAIRSISLHLRHQITLYKPMGSRFRMSKAPIWFIIKH